jgi:D-3-phosphoglycerate dehydrogenase
VARIGPYLRVGGKLGRLIGQLHAGQVKRICLRFEGEIAGYDSTPVVAHALKGILETIVEGNVNEINAREIARSRGIDVEVTTSASAEDFVSTVTATLVGDKGETSAAGTVFGKRDPRIVRVNSFLLEAMRAEGVLVMITNKDVPGVVGKLGTIFGARGVNIAQMHVGRTGPDSKVALTVVAVDGEAPDVLLGDLRAVPEIQSVTRVVL